MGGEEENQAPSVTEVVRKEEEEGFGSTITNDEQMYKTH